MSKSTWSYSRANTYHNCPKAYKLLYLDRVEKKDNAFALWGSLIHECLEKYFIGELDLFSLVDYYDSRYSEIMTEDFPYNKFVDMNDSYYRHGIDYLSNFGGLPDGYEVVGVEKEINIKVGEYDLIGYIDLILKDTFDGGFIIVDHKSAKELKGESLEGYLHQIYLYSLYIFETYGVYPKYLVFNLIKSGTTMKFEFSKQTLNDSVSWFINTVVAAESAENFKDMIELSGKTDGFTKNDWYCNNLCSARGQCERSKCYEGDDLDWL